MRHLQLVGVIFLAFLAGGLGAYFTSMNSNPQAEAPVKESVFDRVMRTQTIRCGYNIAFPNFMKDPNNGSFSGVFHDYTEALGKALNLKVEWAEETGWGDFPTALESGRIDAMCSDIWPNAARSRQSDFVTPIYFTAIYAYGRADDMRFDNNLAAIDDPSVTVSTMDGEMSILIATNDFPKAKVVQLPQLSNKPEILVNITTKKADVTFQDPTTIEKFNQNSPDKIRRISSKMPLRVFGNTIAIAQGQDKFRRMLDTATIELIASGQIDKILAKYEEFPGILLRVAPPFSENLNGPQ